MATVEQVLLRKAEELQAQLDAVHTTLRLLQRQPSSNGGPMVADLNVAHSDKRTHKKWPGTHVSQELVDAVVDVVRTAGHRVQIDRIRQLLATAGVRKHESTVTTAVRNGMAAGAIKRVARGWYEAT